MKNELDERRKLSLRQNKAIERDVVFDGLRTINAAAEITDAVYVGLGSVWFADFHLAHKILRVQTMVSVECDEIVFKRATFNRPYRTITVMHGMSAEVIPELLVDPVLVDRPWIVWLDFDKAMDEDRLAELAALTTALPARSFLLTTFNASGGRYGRQPASRPSRLADLFGDAAPDPLPSVAECKDDALFASILAQATEDYLVAKTVRSGRRGGPMIPSFRIVYGDGAPMVTVGGFLPDDATAGAVRAITGDASWIGLIDEPIMTAPLTAKEVTALQQALPCGPALLTRTAVQAMGFDLEEGHLNAFVRHYLSYPSFAQLAK